MFGILATMSDHSSQPQLPEEVAGKDLELGVLLAAVALKDKIAFESLYELTVDRLFGLALRITQSRGVAEEVLSDVYLQVWRTAGKYSANRGSVMAWLSVICRSRALDRIRASQRVAGKEESLEDCQLQSNTAIAPDLLEAVEQQSALHDALSSLDTSSRQLLELAYFGDYSHRELSELTGKPIGTVKTQIRRAIIQLNKRMCGSIDKPGVTL